MEPRSKVFLRAHIFLVIIWRNNRIVTSSLLPKLAFSRTVYASSLFDIMKSHLPSVHTYADDTQLYISFNPVDNTSEADAVIAIENCIRDVRAWMRDDKLMLNDDKTEFLIIGTERQLSRVSVDKIKIAIWAQFGHLVRFSSGHVDSRD